MIEQPMSAISFRPAAVNCFNMFFHGQSLTLLEWICMQSFVEHGHRLQLHSYEPIEVPTGVEVVDAGNTIPYDDFFIFDNSPSAFTNMFRYKLLLECGGWWVDTDVLCLTEDIPPCTYAWSYQDPEQINGAVLKFPQGDSVCKILLDKSKERSTSLSAWGQLGPALLTEVLAEFHPRGHFGSPEKFYPTHWLEAHICWTKGMCDFVESRVKNAVFLHFWNSVLTRMGITLANRAPSDSFFERLQFNRNDLDETSPDMERQINENIRYILTWKPRYRDLYEKKMKREWNYIFPV